LQSQKEETTWVRGRGIPRQVKRKSRSAEANNRPLKRETDRRSVWAGER